MTLYTRPDAEPPPAQTILRKAATDLRALWPSPWHQHLATMCDAAAAGDAEATCNAARSAVAARPGA